MKIKRVAIWLLWGAPVLLCNLPLEVAAVPPCVSAPDGLVSWWPGNGAAEDAMKVSVGVISNGVTFVAGTVGEAFSFDGLSAAVITDLDVQPSAMPESTWEAWVYPMRLNHGARQQILSDDDGSYDRSLLIESGTDQFAVFTGQGRWLAAKATLNEWQHVAVVFKRDNILLYRNGIEFSFGSAPSGQESRSKLHMGRNPVYGEYFKGLIDEVSIYRRTLAANEIQALFASASAGKCSSDQAGPRLRIQRGAARQVTISWPASAFSYELQSAPSLSPLTPWTPVLTAPAVVDDTLAVVVPASDQAWSFRLHLPAVPLQSF